MELFVFKKTKQTFLEGSVDRAIYKDYIVNRRFFTYCSLACVTDGMAATLPSEPPAYRGADKGYKTCHSSLYAKLPVSTQRVEKKAHPPLTVRKDWDGLFTPRWLSRAVDQGASTVRANGRYLLPLASNSWRLCRRSAVHNRGKERGG